MKSTGHDRGGLCLALFIVCVVVAAVPAARAQTLPSGFSATNIGNPSLIGSATFSNGVFSAKAAGTDIWGTADQFMFVHRQMTGDGTIVARVASLQHVDAWSKAGVMVRESLAANAKHAFMAVSGTSGTAFQRRRTTGGSSVHTGGGSGTAPVWLKLERRGSTLTASRSSTGSTWTVVGTDSIAMTATVYVGLALTSHNAGLRASATFSNVTMPGYPTASGLLPVGWVSAHVGAPGVVGSAAYSGSTFTVQSAGADVWGTADQFMFVHRSLAGDGTIVARVASLQHAASWSKAGVMIRESLAANAKHAFMLVSGGNGAAFQRRRSTGGSSVHTGGGSGTAPLWLKLERRGSAFTASRSADGVSWTVVGTDSISMAATVHVGLAVSSINTGVATTAAFSNLSVGLGSVSGLPSGWTSGDVGSPAVSGSASHSGSTFTVRSTGIDIWGTSDQFRFVYRPVSGDVDVIARAASLQNTHAWAKAGVMVRSSLAANASHASLFVTPGNGVAFQRRSSTGAQSVHTGGGSGQAPVWLKLERRGGTVRAFRSTNGTSWTSIGSQTLSLPSTFYVGLAVSSPNTSAGTTATFDGVIVQPASSSANQPPSVSLTAPASGATYTAPASITLSASASDSDGSVSRVDFYHGSTLIGSDTSSPFGITWSNVPAGTYSLVAVARDNAGASTVSADRTVHVIDAHVPGWAVFVPSSNHATAVTNYVLAIFPAGADPRTANAVATQNLGKPAVVNGECRADISRTVAGLPPGRYIAVVSAIGAGGSASSVPSSSFTR